MARIIDFTDILNALANDDVFIVEDISTNETKKITGLALKTFILEGKALGGTAGGDITTNNATQELTNKKLTSPKINSNTVITTTSEEFNKLHGVICTTAQFNYLTGLTGNVQTQLTSKASSVELQFRPYFYSGTFTAGSTILSITEYMIRTFLGIGISYRIDSQVMVMAYDADSVPAYYPLSHSDMVVYKNSGASTYLDRIDISVISGQAYRVAIICSLVPYGGV